MLWCAVSTSLTRQNRGREDSHVRWVTRELEELLDGVARGGPLIRVRVALLELADARDDLVEVQRCLVAEAEVLRDAVEAREHLDARHDIAVRVFHVRNGQHPRRQEYAERWQGRPLPQEACAQ
jgi:hypothetical protein